MECGTIQIEVEEEINDIQGLFSQTTNQCNSTFSTTCFIAIQLLVLNNPKKLSLTGVDCGVCCQSGVDRGTMK